MEPIESKLQGEEFWRAHLLKAREFSGSDREYCQTNGLSKGAFYIYKRRLGFTKPSKPRRNTFVKVAPVPERVEKPTKLEDGHLPDPKWLAQFAIGLIGKR